MTKRLSNFCCCLSVRTGALIVAAIGIVGALNGIVVNSMEAAENESFNAYVQDFESEMKQKLENGTLTQKEYDHQMELFNFTVKSQPYLYIVGIIASLLMLAMSAMVIYGLLSERPAFLVPFLVVEMFSLVASAVGVLVFGITILALQSALQAIIILTLSVPVLILGFYFWSVVHAAYLNLRDGDGNYVDFRMKSSGTDGTRTGSSGV